MNRRIRILDSTLREGEQTPGVYFDPHIKVAIAQLLAEVGVDFMEAGHPAVTEEIHRSVCQLASLPVCVKVGAHARSLQSDVDLALECGVRFLGIFYCVSEQRLAHHGTELDCALDQIGKTIAYARERQADLVIRYTPEDAVRSTYEHVLKASEVAVRNGADIISLADTTGFMIPGGPRSLGNLVNRLKGDMALLGLDPDIAIHCHNDRGLALANALDGLNGGASVVDASVLGLGERAGIVDLASLLALLSERPEHQDRWNLSKLPELYDLVSRYSGVPIPVHHPVIGKYAFTHCAGVHTQAALRNPIHYESLSPEKFGRRTGICLDHMSGRSALEYSLGQLGLSDIDHLDTQELLKRVKVIGMKGRTVDEDELRFLVSSLNRQKESRNANRFLTQSHS